MNGTNYSLHVLCHPEQKRGSLGLNSLEEGNRRNSASFLPKCWLGSQAGSFKADLSQLFNSHIFIMKGCIEVTEK